jgi:hypothetical protein
LNDENFPSPNVKVEHKRTIYQDFVVCFIDDDTANDGKCENYFFAVNLIKYVMKVKMRVSTQIAIYLINTS